jgi:hypothetical protein
MHAGPNAYAVGAGRLTHVTAVDGEARRGRIAVGLHVEHRIGTVGIPAADQVQRRRSIPVGSVEVKGVLAGLAIVTDQPFFIDVGEIPLVAGIAREVE